MKRVLFAFALLFAFNAFAEEQVDIIPALVKKLEERDLTIQELRAANLDLLVTNLGLKQANAELRRSLQKSNKALYSLRIKYQKLMEEAAENSLKSVSKSTEELKDNAIANIRSVLQSLDKKLAK